ncbi:nuclease PIN [Cohnella sp. CIP 111063]|uniref:YIP1 family protein n=1 Tax=unclassified Cohnella TaxID=2636738 RepID=UPI000B8BBE83|nr:MULTISPECIES: YIP1 family protein [unclassified Cohnella]OXS52827.1 nuclease PIN [Cohnella sp. CIP 111063]PRX59800.1 NHL repeat-containing protein [Cohnella sp. SGD-V74]
MHRRLALRIALLGIVGIIAALSVYPRQVRGGVPYQTYYRDNYNQQYQIQTAYMPAGVFGRELFAEDPAHPGELKISPLSQPQDLFIDSRDQIYIVDTGNNRIVHLDKDGSLIRLLEPKDNPLRRPQGVYVHTNGDIYIADTGNNRVLRLDRDGRVLAEFGRPDSKLIPASFKFDPVKLVVDKRGFLYIATLGGYQGLLQLDPEGQFQGFFGANKTSASFIDSVKRLLYSREMYEREISKLPGSITSVDINREGFIYTVTKEVSKGQLKKLNIAGLDQLAGKGEFADTLSDGQFGESIRQFGRMPLVSPQLNDLTVDTDGNMTVIDTRLNVVSQYDGNGNLLFFWGGEAGDTTTKLGLVKLPSAIASDSANQLYILDSENNVVQKYVLSEFGKLVHQANGLTQDGRYEDSEPLWREVYRQNAFYAPAVLGLAKAAYKKGDYEEAQRLFQSAGGVQGYSDSFWQNRLLWFQNRFGLFMNLILGLAALVYIARYASRRLGWRPSLLGERIRKPRGSIGRHLKQLGHAFYVMKHPLDGFYGIRYEGKANPLSASIWLLLAVAAYGFMKARTNFIFNPSILFEAQIVNALIQFGVVWLGFVIANYLTSSLTQGEGRFRDVYTASAYAMFPIVLVGVPLTIVSGVMTLSEASIFYFIQYGLYGWAALLLFWQVQGVQNFSVGETVKSLSLSVLTMLVIGILLFIVFSLTSELVSFVYSIYQEVVIR